MLKDVTSVRAFDDRRIHVRFEDGMEGILDVAERVGFTGIFAALSEADVFRQVAVNRELGTVVWPNGADLDPDVLYAWVAGLPSTEVALRPSAE